MQLNIEKNSFYKMTTLSSVKSYQSKIKDVNILESRANGNIEISLYYYNNDSKECFENILIPFDLDMEGLSIETINLVKTNVFVIEANGINVEYELEIETLKARIAYYESLESLQPFLKKTKKLDK